MAAPVFKLLYTEVDSVKARLTNKVQFQAQVGEVQDGELPDILLLQLISDAETEVEQDLRGRYAIPFRSIRAGSFAGLPDHSRRAIRQMCDMKAAWKVLGTDFGRGSSVNGDNYRKTLGEDYDTLLMKLMGQDVEGKQLDRFRFTPPLDDLMLSPQNSEADDGYKGAVLVSGVPNEALRYAERQVNDPSLATFNGWRGRRWR